MEQFNQNSLSSQKKITSIDIKKELLQYLQFWPWFLVAVYSHR